MKMIIVVACALVALAAAAPSSEPAPVTVVRQEVTRQPDGSYKFLVETSDGVIREESGDLVEVKNEENKAVKVIVVRGLYTIPDAEGHPDTITYVGNENGYSADGPSIPKAPEVSRR